MNKKEKLSYRIQQIFIGVIHIALLYWIFYTLNNAGHMPMLNVMYHFIGMSLYGALLIRGTAFWAKRHHLNQHRQKHQRHHKKKCLNLLELQIGLMSLKTQFGIVMNYHYS